MTSFNIKWIVFTPVMDGGFSRNYRSALKKAGFKSVGPNGDIYAEFYNSSNPESVNRAFEKVKKFNAKASQYKRKLAILAFTITDKQFGLIGTNKVNWCKCKIPSSLGVIPVTYEQMYESGCIPVVGSQARPGHPNTKMLN